MRSPFRPILALVPVLMVLGIYLTSGAQETRVPPDRLYTVTSLSGAVSLKKADAARWRQAYLGAVLVSGDSLKTAADGYASLSTKDGDDILVTPGTSLQIGSLGEAEAGVGEGFSLRLAVGRILVQITRLRSALQQLFSFTVRTPTALAGVRGTLFCLDVAEDGTTELTVFRGTVSLIAAERALDVGPGKRSKVRPGEHPLPPETFSREKMVKDEKEGKWLEEVQQKVKDDEKSPDSDDEDDVGEKTDHEGGEDKKKDGARDERKEEEEHKEIEQKEDTRDDYPSSDREEEQPPPAREFLRDEFDE